MNRLDQFARGLLPLFTLLTVIVFSAVPTGLPLYAMVAPQLALMTLYYWSIYRPELLNPLMVLVLGLLQDMLTGRFPGVTSFILLVAYFVVVSQHRFFHGKSFSVVWWGFMLVAPGAAFIAWFANIALSGQWIDPTSSLVGLILTIMLYPVIAGLLSQVHKLVPAREAIP